MGFNLQPNPPEITLTNSGGTSNTYAVGALDNASIVNMYVVGVFIQVGSDWNQQSNIGQYVNPGDMYADCQAKGGIGPYAQWVAAQVNAAFAALGFTTNFVIPSTVVYPPVSDDPSTLAALLVGIQLGIFVSNAIPAKMQSDYVNGLTVTSEPWAIGHSEPWGGGQLSKMADKLLLFVDPNGVTFWLTPETNLTTFAKASSYAANYYKTNYGYTP